MNNSNNVQNQNLQGKEFANAAFFCKIGQETVQDIVTKTTDMMALIKTLQLPNGTAISNSQHEEKKNKLKNEMLKNISILFKRLYKVYEKCLESYSSIEDIEPESLIPIIDEELTFKKTNNDSLKDLNIEYDEQLKILKSKNVRIKQIIDSLRELIWEINTMLAMKRTPY